MIKIVFTRGSRAGEEISLDMSSPILIGRSHAATVRLTEPDISGRHIEIVVDADGVCAVSLGGRGFVVNGETVEKGSSRVLATGDEVSIGSNVRFRVYVDDDNASESEFFKVEKAVKNLVSKGEISRATEMLKEFTSKEPSNSLAKMLYGSCCLLLGDEGTFRVVYDELVPEIMKRHEGMSADELSRFTFSRYKFNVYCDALDLLSQIERLQSEGKLDTAS